MKIKKFALFILFLSSIQAFAYVHQRTLAGSDFSWVGTTNINLYVLGDNASGISNSNILLRVQESAAEWNSTGSGPTLSVSTTTSVGQGKNDIYFSTNPIFFSSSSVIAVTESVYNESDGRILESDIIIKDSVLFSNSKTTAPYIGDVLTHEMGHLLGMDHSSLPFSSMFYKLVRGQTSISYDDKLGKNSLYSTSSTGIISGKVAGGAGEVGVFGADVQLISSLSGRVIASTFSESDGAFSFNGVPLNDTYYIYIKPISALSAFSSYYQTAKNDFCTGFASYKGTFVESCDSSRKGYPQGVQLNSSYPTRDIGTVTIKCDLRTPLDYFTGREAGNFDLAEADKEGDSFVGYFTEADIVDGKDDVITIDLSHVNSSSGDLYLDLSLLSQDFQSRVSYTMEVTSGTGFYQYTYSTDLDFNPNLNLKAKIPLDAAVPANNIFTIRIIPENFDNFLLTSPFPLESYFFPDFSNIGDERFFYQFIFFIGQNTGEEYTVYDHYNYQSPRGNSRCMEAQKTYGVKPAGAVTGVTSESTAKRTKAESAIACGSVALVGDDDGQGPGAGASIVLGLLISFLFFLPKRSRYISF